MTQTTVDPALTGRLAAIRSMPILPPQNLWLPGSKLPELQFGGIIAIGDTIYRVEERNRYESGKNGKWKWHEVKLYCFNTGETTYLEWEIDDEIEILIQEKKLRWQDMPINKADLSRIDDEEEGGFSYEGRRYNYTDSDDARFFRNEQPQGDEFYYWDFESPDGYLIGFEKWTEGAEYEVFLCCYLKPSQIRIVQLKG